MLNNKKTKKKKAIKRVVNFIAPVYTPNSIRLCVKYIIDHGDLISDIQAVHTDYVSFPDHDAMNEQIQKYAASKQKVKHDLEYQIYATGATRYNAEVTAKKLFDQYVLQRGS